MTPDRAVSTTADIIRSFSKAVPLRPKLGFFVRRLLGNSEVVADLSPQGASAMGARHGLARWHTAPDRARELPQRLALGLPPRLHSFPRFLRASGIGAGPALDIGSVDDPAQTPGTANDRVARGAQRFCDLGSGASCGLQRQQPFVTRWRPTRLHGGAPPALEDTKLRRAGFTLPIPRCSALDPVTRIDRDARGRHGLRRVKHIACESSSARRDRFACAINPAGPHRDAPPIPPGRAWLRGNAPAPKDRVPAPRGGARRRAF
jgi:hypothetical protein